MSELISGKEALIALVNGEDVQIESNKQWVAVDNCQIYQFLYNNCDYKFRIKPRTIKLNNIEIPAPFEPKEGDDCRCYYIDTGSKLGYDWHHCSHYGAGKIVWRTEQQIQQVVAALRSVFKGV